MDGMAVDVATGYICSHVFGILKNLSHASSPTFIILTQVALVKTSEETEDCLHLPKQKKTLPRNSCPAKKKKNSTASLTFVISHSANSSYRAAPPLKTLPPSADKRQTARSAAVQPPLTD